MVSIANELIKYSAISDIASLGSGIGFGSFHAEGAIELNYGDIEKISEELRADILLFDFWIQNDDRCLGTNGGNPNMLWKAPQNELILIDHNNAFNTQFQSQEFFNSHAFGAAKDYWDKEYLADRQRKLLAILENLPDKVTSLPEEWFCDDEIKELPLNVALDRMQSVLRRIESNFNVFGEINP